LKIGSSRIPCDALKDRHSFADIQDTAGALGSTFHVISRDSYTVLIGPGYCDTKESMVSNVTPSTVACATKILSKGSL